MSKELEILLDEIQNKTALTLEEIAEKAGYSRPHLNKAKKSGNDKKVVGRVREAFAQVLQNGTKGDKKLAIDLEKEAMAKEILHLKATVKAQGDLLVKLAAAYYDRQLGEVSKELRDNTSLIMLDQEGS